MQVKKIQNEFFKYFWQALENTNLPIQGYFIISRRGKETTPLRQEWLVPKLETLLHLWPFFCINIAFSLPACSFLLNRRHLHAGKPSLCQHKSSPCIIRQTSHQFYSFLNVWKTSNSKTGTKERGNWSTN